MKKLMITSCLLSMLAVACNSEKKDATTDSTQKDSVMETAAKPLDSAQEAKAWADYMTPSDAHKVMATANGKWEAEISTYMKPDQPPAVSKATCENKMILGGRYQQSTYIGSFEGMPFEGMNIMGYDNAKKKYVSSWVDNFGTGIMFMEGDMEPKTRTITLNGKMTDVATGKDISVRETFMFIDDNTQQMEMFDTKNGKETKTMSIMLKRAK